MKQIDRKYVESSCKLNKAKQAKSTSLSEATERWENGHILQPLSEEQNEDNMGFLWRLKDEAPWSVWRIEKNQKFVLEIECSGSLLDSFSSWTIPTIFPDPTREDGTRIADSHLNEPVLKNQ